MWGTTARERAGRKNSVEGGWVSWQATTFLVRPSNGCRTCVYQLNFCFPNAGASDTSGEAGGSERTERVTLGARGGLQPRRRWAGADSDTNRGCTPLHAYKLERRMGEEVEHDELVCCLRIARADAADAASASVIL